MFRDRTDSWLDAFRALGNELSLTKYGDMIA